MAIRKVPNVLIVDDNRDLLQFLQRLMAESGWNIIVAESARNARKIAAKAELNAALVDYMLPDGNGVELAAQMTQRIPGLQITLMTAAQLPAEEQAICEEREWQILRKPFLAADVMNRIRSGIGVGLRRATKRTRHGRPLSPRSTSESDRKTESKALRVFFCYSHRDEKLRDRLDAHLSMLRRMGIIETWHDRKIKPGDDWNESIDQFLNSSDLVLLLISPDFLNSDCCFRKEMKRAIERHQAGEARVIPVILRPVDWERAPFSMLQAVPTDGRPITRFSNRDDGFLDAAKNIRRIAEELSATIRRVRPSLPPERFAGS